MDNDTPKLLRLGLPRSDIGMVLRGKAEHYMRAGWRDIAEAEDGQVHVVLGPESGLTAVQCDAGDWESVRESPRTYVLSDRSTDRYFLLFARPPDVRIERTVVVVRRTKVAVLGDGYRLGLPTQGHDAIYWCDLTSHPEHREALQITPMPLRYEAAVTAETILRDRADGKMRLLEFILRHDGVSKMDVDEADHVGGSRRQRRQDLSTLEADGLVERREVRRVEGAAARSKTLFFGQQGEKSSTTPSGGEVPR